MPLTEPAEVSVTRSTEDASVVVVSWRPFTLVEARGFIEYIVQLHEASSSKRQQPLTMRANMTQSSVTFTGLDTGIDYTVSVGTASLSSEGTTGPGQ